MSPRPPKSNNFKATKIATMLVARLGDEAAIEPQITTGQGVKVPDVGWLLHALALGGSAAGASGACVWGGR